MRKWLRNQDSKDMTYLTFRQRLGSAQRFIPRDRFLLLNLILVILVLLIGLGLPLARVLMVALSEGAQPFFFRYLGSAVYGRIIFNTLLLGLLVGVMGTTLGFIFAFLYVRVDVPFKRLFHWVALLPIITPPFAIATSSVILFGANGFISHQILGVRNTALYGLNGLVLVQVLSTFSVAYLSLVGLFRSMDPALEEAAMDLGATRWDAFWRVTFPLVTPGLASSFLLLFVEAIADIANPLILGGDFTVLASRIYIAITGEFDTVAAAMLSIILVLPSLVVFMVQHYWISRKSVIVVTGRPSGELSVITHPVVRWSLFAVTMGVSSLILLMHGTIWVGAFTRLIGIDNTLTLDHFAFILLGIGAKAITDTTVLTVLAVSIATFLGLAIAWLGVRHQFVGNGLLDGFSMLGIAVPGTVIGIGYVMTFRNPIKIGELTILPALQGGTALAGGAMALILVYVVRSLPGAVRAGMAALQQIDVSIEEAAASLGAGNSMVLQRVILPLIQPAMLTGLVFGFTSAMASVSAVLFLVTPETEIMSVQILNEIDAGRFGNAFAYCLVLMAIVVSVLGVLQIVVGKVQMAISEWVGTR